MLPATMSTRRGSTMSTTGALWRAIEPIYAAILAHPFLRGLTDGSLPGETFRFYAVQDALYLRDFARALSLAAAHAPREEWIIMLNEHAAGALTVERTLHESFFKDWGLTPEAVAATPAGAHQPRLHLVPARGRLRPAVPRGDRRAAALLLDLLGGGQDPRARELARPALRALDRHLRLRGVRRGGAGGARVHRHPRGARSATTTAPPCTATS